jgi:hypothetical protein
MHCAGLSGKELLLNFEERLNTDTAGHTVGEAWVHTD